MDELSLRLGVKYECGLAPTSAEDNPTLCVYLPSTFQREPVIVEPRMTDPNHEDIITVSGMHSSNPIKRDTCVMVRGFCSVRNDYGAPCDVDAGEAAFNLCDMMRCAEETPLSRCEFSHDMNMWTAGGFVKGKVTLCASKQDFNLGKLVFEKSSEKTEDLGCNAEEIGCAVNDYIARTMQIEGSMNVTRRGTERIRCPCDPSEDRINGLEMVRLPAAAYVMYETPRATKGFWENLLRTVMARENMTEHQYPCLPLAQKARLLALFICAIPEALDYVRECPEELRLEVTATCFSILDHLFHRLPRAQDRQLEHGGCLLSSRTN